MSKFIVGDHVFVADEASVFYGEAGTVELVGGGVTVVLESGRRVSRSSMYLDHFELIPASEDVPDPVPDQVSHPAHYTSYPVEVIQLTEHMNFCRGNAVKYVARAGLKDKSKEVEDLEKAVWYLNREIQRLKELSNGR